MVPWLSCAKVKVDCFHHLNISLVMTLRDAVDVHSDE